MRQRHLPLHPTAIYPAAPTTEAVLLVEHGMNLRRQCAKADIERMTRILAGEHEKADYIGYLTIVMISEAEAGRPQPWSHYQPRIAEEFDA